MSVVDNERPPYVQFERRPVEDRAETMRVGHYVAKDVDFAIVTRPGSRDSLDVEAASWLKSLKDKARGGMIPDSWPRLFDDAYKRWLEGETLPAHGTPIKGWQLASPALQMQIIRAGYLTVEDLAGASDSEVANIGTGGLSMKLKAAAWLEEGSSKGKVAEQIADMKSRQDQLEASNRELAAEVARLGQFEPKPEKQTAAAFAG